MANNSEQQSGSMRANTSPLAYKALLAAAFCAGFSLPLARAAMAVTLLLTLWEVFRGRLRLRMSATAWVWIAYILLAFITTKVLVYTSNDPLIEPARGIKKLTKLIWFMGLLITPALVDSRERFLRILLALAYGTGVGATRALLGNTIGAWIQVTLPLEGDPTPQAGSASARLLSLTDSLGLTQRLRGWTAHHWRARTYNDSLAKLAGMGEAQRMMVGSVVALGLALHARLTGATRQVLRRRWALALLVFAGLAIALKRGPWISFALVGAFMLVAVSGLRRSLPVMILGLALVLSLPAARERLAQLPSEFSDHKGGRALMWRHVVPGLLRDHPGGVGYRSLTNDAMRRYARRVEQLQTHVHSNPLQILVELGYHGLALYILWMIVTARAALRQARGRGDCLSAGRADADRLLYALPLAVLAVLTINGFTEYNFNDAEMVLIYGLAMGLADCRQPKP
jgi:hypothetical protein